MANMNVRDVPETVAEGMAEIARELGMSREAYARKLFAEAVMEAGYRKLADQIANDPEEQAYRRAMHTRRADDVRRWDREDRATGAGGAA